MSDCRISHDDVFFLDVEHYVMLCHVMMQLGMAFTLKNLRDKLSKKRVDRAIEEFNYFIDQKDFGPKEYLIRILYELVKNPDCNIDDLDGIINKVTAEERL